MHRIRMIGYKLYTALIGSGKDEGQIVDLSEPAKLSLDAHVPAAIAVCMSDRIALRDDAVQSLAGTRKHIDHIILSQKIVQGASNGHRYESVAGIYPLCRRSLVH